MNPATKTKFCKVAVAIALASGLTAWLFLQRDAAPPVAGGTATPPSPKPQAAQPAEPAANPATPLPVAGTDFNTETSDEDLLRLARTVVARSPRDALFWAQSQTDPALRDRLLFAVLRAWGETDPRAAVDWALKQDESRRYVQVEAALTGAAVQTDLALQIGRELLAENPVTGAAYGLALVGALSASGKFSAAMEFANEGPAEARGDWMENIFHRWGQSSPEEAVKTMAAIEDKSLRLTAYESLIAGWAVGNPSGLTTHALTMPEGDTRTRTLNTALASWCEQDPAALGGWLNSFDSSPELDRAIALLLSKTDSVNRSPEVAMSWVASMGDSKLQRESLVHVLKEWVQADSTAAWQYLKSASWIPERDREEIQKNVAAPATSIPGQLD